MYRKISWLIALAILLIGCKSMDYSETPWSILSLESQLQSLVNKAKYDDALATWGEPISTFEGDEIFVVTWGFEVVGSTLSIASPVGAGAIVATGQQRSGWKISATFHKETRILTSIRHTWW